MALVQQFFPTFFYNGRPMSGGSINFFRNDDQITTQPAYSDAGGLNPFVTRSIDENGQVTGTPQIFLDDALAYYVSVKDSGGTVRYEYFGLPNVAGGGSTTNNYTSANLAPNPQFYQHQKETLTIVDGTALDIAPPNWQFLRSSTVAPTDTIEFMTDTTATPIGAQAKSTPTYWFEYNKTTAGTAVSEIKIFFKFPTVRALANELITFKADVYCDNAVSFDFFARQFHGTAGGGGTVNQVLGTDSIAGGEINSWVTKTITATVNNLAGTIDDSDDYVWFGVDLTGLYALVAAEFRITNVQLILGADTNNYDWSPVWYDASTSLPTPDPANDDGKIPVVNDSGYYELQQPGDTVDNLIWGGDFTVNPWQEGVGPRAVAAAASASEYMTDGYKLEALSASSAFAFSYQKQADAPTLSESNHFTQDSLYLQLTAGAAAIQAGDLIRAQHVIEGYDWLAVGTQAFSIGFWVKSSVAGTYCVALQNNADDLTYIHEYTISAINTWEKVEFTVPAYSGGTWSYDENPGLIISWTFAAGSTYTIPTASKDAWALNAGKFATDAIANWAAAGTPTVQIALPQLHRGDTIPPYPEAFYPDVLRKAQRYYEQSLLVGNYRGTVSQVNFAYGEARSPAAGNPNLYDAAQYFNEPKRIAPTMTNYSVRNGGAASTLNNISPGLLTSGFAGDLTVNTWSGATVFQTGYLSSALLTPGNGYSYHWFADARF